MKTVRQHLNDLKEPERTKALRYMEPSESGKMVAHPETALFLSFDWSLTKEGTFFWDNISSKLIDGEYFDAPQLTPETCEAKAKEVMHERPATQEDYDKLENRSSLPTDPDERKEIPVYSGCVNYFPLALAAVARLSKKGNDQHNPGTPLHWDRSKSGDELDAMMRHVIDGDWDAVAWRALAHLQKQEEERLSND